ncbi:amidohydrolase family protein [Pseudoflavonifractor sp. 524-17]|uniref:amidohydrolase family protein n=1 Tax=Pseudoflavonifractor sp. 524-17 TaxID=2304577 RepID=UPI00137A3941|nr:amidohydrolase family protein [Pseudoflavonifractor sp. 524-17]
MESYQVILRGGTPLGMAAGTDIAVSGGKIAAVGPSLPGRAELEIDAAGTLISPSFVDSHMHLDKVLTGLEEDATDTWAAVQIMLRHAKSLPRDQVREDVKRRARQVIDWEIAHGSSTLKSHVYCNGIWGLESVYAHRELKEEYAGRADILNIVPWPDDGDSALIDQLDQLARQGCVDFIGGFPYGMPDYRARIDAIFRKAEQFSLPIDLHVDEKDIPDANAFAYICQKTIDTRMEGRVTCGHLTTLSALPDEEAKPLIELAAQAKINVITLPSCNMYLRGREDAQPIRRGVTRIHDFLQAGVNIAYASDNIRDPFRPFGNGDMLEEGLFTAQVMQYGTRDALDKVFHMGTYAAAQNCLLTGYGLDTGCRADLTVIDAPTPSDALKSLSRRLWVLKDGRVVARDGVLV